MGEPSEAQGMPAMSDDSYLVVGHVPHADRRPFEVADRVRVIQTHETGSVAENGEAGLYLLLDGAGYTEEYDPLEVEHYDGPPHVPGKPVRDGLPGVGDALLGLAAILGQQLPDDPVVQAKLAELKAAVESAMPTEQISDGHGNGWKLCGPGCDLAVVEPGKAECSGVRCRS